MKNLFLTIICFLFLFSCNFTKQNESVGLSFFVDVNKLKQIASSNSSLQGGTSSIGVNTAASTSVQNADQLQFFGIVLRDVEGTVIKNSAGYPLGNVLSGASKTLNMWKDPYALTELNETGIIKMVVDVPSPSEVSITVFAVFIREDDYSHGPETWTSVFHVSGPYAIDGASTTITVNVSGEVLEDDHAPFVDWAAFFADAGGNPIAGGDLKVRHCKIGFTFEQSMFDDNFEERYIFRTDSKGRIESLIPGSGVDWEISMNGRLLRPCGSSILNTANYPSGSPEILFSGFAGNTLYNNPYDFGNAVSVPANFGLLNLGASAVDTTADHDGDGLPTSIELTETYTNPFRDNEILHEDFNGDLAHLRYIKYTSPYVDIEFEVNINNTVGDCESGDANVFLWNGSAWVSQGVPTLYNSGGDYAECDFTITSSALDSIVGANTVGNIYLKINSGFDADFDGDLTFDDDLVFYKSFRWCTGTGCGTSSTTISSVALKKYFWSDGPLDRSDPVTNYLSLFPRSCNDNWNYLLTIFGSGFKAGGGAYFSDDDCSSEYQNVNSNRVYFWHRAAWDDLYQYEMSYHDNEVTNNLKFCYKNAINSSFSEMAIPTFKFIQDPNYVPCDYGGEITGPHYIFITSLTMTGDFGTEATNNFPTNCSTMTGIPAASCICQQLGDSGTQTAGLGKTWRALVSDSVTDANSQVTLSAEVKQINSVGSEYTIDSDYDIFGGSQTAGKVAYDEDGTAVTRTIWTGSDASGTYASNACADWTEGSASMGVTGDSSQYLNTPNWFFDSSTTSCSTPASLYCISESVLIE